MSAGKTIGIDRLVELRWLDAVAAQVSAGKPVADVYRFAWDLLEGEVRGNDPHSGRGKTATVLMRIWAKTPPELVPLRDHGLCLLEASPGGNSLAAHWGMAMATHAFFFDVATAIGRVLALQEQVALAQIGRRVAERWGERPTIKTACRRLVRSIVRWRALDDPTGKGLFRKIEKPIPVEGLAALFLVDALLHSVDGGAAPFSALLTHPALFPFQVPLSLGELRTSGRFEVDREGLEIEMVRRAPRTDAWQHVNERNGHGSQ